MTLLVANGTVTNGRVHPDLNLSKAYMYSDPGDAKWNTPLTSKPDSIAGWFKFAPQPSDTLEVKVLLHKGHGQEPDQGYLGDRVATALYRSGMNTGSNWVRFSTPFKYISGDAPQYILVILNSGNGFNPVAGSIAYFDDLELIYNSNSIQDNAINFPDVVYADGNQNIILQSSRPERYNNARILDITGRTVWNGNLVSGRIDISGLNLKKGLYLVSLSGDKAVLTQKIVIR
jgi:hypothetical protein